MTSPTTIVPLPATSSSRPMRLSVVALAGATTLATMANAKAPRSNLFMTVIENPPWRRTFLPRKNPEARRGSTE